jgi:RimJ/RimL family protein N-acetyltransferase
MPNYFCLKSNIFQDGPYSLVPIRDLDKWAIMKMRNEQIYHLRQAKPLTEEIQKAYFEDVVAKLFNQEQPDQILFSLLENDEFIGYGGLVHINWNDKNAELSFVMRTELEKEKFANYWVIYLGLIEKVAFEDLHFHKIFTYAFDLRPHLYDVLEKVNFTNEAVLKEHCFFDQRYLDVVIHSKIKNGAKI